MNNNLQATESRNNAGGLISYDQSQIDLFFTMHQKVNSKNEEISKSYTNNILVSFNDLKELHQKTVQSIESTKPIKSTIGVRIAISHNEGESEKFNSFEDFEKHNITSPNPTSDITFIYIFSIYDQEKSDFENYKITNRVRSRVAELDQLEKEAPPFISSAIISSMVTQTAKISIEYADYVKARHFTAMFDEWIKGCDESKSIKAMNYFKRISHLIPKLGKLAIYALLAIFTTQAIDTNLINNDLSVKFIVMYASVFVITGGVCELFLRKIETSIDGYLAISYLNINKGDAKLIKRFSNRNIVSIVWSVIGATGTIVIGLGTSAAYDVIKWLILK
ncbi:hypothetical protein [Cellvibrio fibrivorans]|uniref:Uncharacterized protein n=1 Tax=Cellvibrio fibrivorans TaxID=126350 RepID=A0ABU1UXL9_9GAMM|nr:hypothetical protein [Cellvibrio fibrivorans]MDR7089944.1 hypothetical protein [Cellvibrio fibrivorans]